MYYTENGYEAYPPDINVIIEQAHRKQNLKVEWIENNDKKYFIEFASMTERISGVDSKGTKVKRITPGEWLPLYHSR